MLIDESKSNEAVKTPKLSWFCQVNQEFEMLSKGEDCLLNLNNGFKIYTRFGIIQSLKVNDSPFLEAYSVSI